MYCEPADITTELTFTVPKQLPVKPVLVVTTDLSLKINALASVASKVCAAPKNHTLPSTLPVAPLCNTTDILLLPLKFNDAPLLIVKSVVGVKPLIFNMLPAVVGCKVTLSLLAMINCPIFCVGTLVAIVLPLVLNIKMSVVSGVVLVGVQLLELWKSPVLPPAQV